MAPCMSYELSLAEALTTRQLIQAGDIKEVLNRRRNVKHGSHYYINEDGVSDDPNKELGGVDPKKGAAVQFLKIQKSFANL